MDRPTFEDLIEAYREMSDTAVEIDETSAKYNRIDFKCDSFPDGHTLGHTALNHGFVVTSVDPQNGIASDDTIHVWFKRFSAKREVRTVEVEREVTIVNTDGRKFSFIDEP